MTSFVRVLMLVACWPLLLPAGVCICTATPSHAAQPKPKSKPCCKRHCGKATESRDTSPQPERPSVPDKHQPGCPAVLTADRSTTGVTFFVTDVASLEVSSYLCVSASPTQERTTKLAANRTSRVPVYLSHCALVI